MSKRLGYQREKANYIAKHGLEAWRAYQRARDRAWEASWIARHGREAWLARKAKAKARRRAALRKRGLTTTGKVPHPKGSPFLGKHIIDGVYHPPKCPCYDCLWGPKPDDPVEDSGKGVPVPRALVNIPGAKHYNHWRRYAS